MTYPKDAQIKLSNLKMDPDNPRHDRLESQREIIEWMTSGNGRVGQKLFVLAQDICEYGINYADRLIVTPSPDGPNIYLALEGNRRTTVLKLLQNLNAVPDKWRQKYRELLKRAKVKPPKSLPCVIYEDRDAAYHFVELKHQGESGGAGTVSWGALEKARHERRRHGKSRSDRSINLLNHVKSSNSFSEEVKKAGEAMRVTTLDRLLSSEKVRDFLGLKDIGSDELGYYIEPNEANRAIQKVIMDFGTGIKKVGDVINKDKRAEYLSEFQGENLPDHTKRLDELVPLPDSDKGLGSRPIGITNPGYQNPGARRYLPLKGQILAINSREFPRQSRIWEELRAMAIQVGSGKPSKVYPNAAALLFRSFLEMSVMTHLERLVIPCPNPKGWREIKLSERIKSVADDVYAKGLLTRTQRGPINRALGNRNSPAHPDTLNNYVHNYNQPVHAADLHNAWEIYWPMLSGLWSCLKGATTP